ncbi:MAG: ThiF family adenylyltransferase [Planctomycetes bacterium]|nr:ThiF family adenylyltransferase [Planctomycetota bacterium]
MNEAQVLRFSRHVLLREVGGRGQERLLAATVVVAGAGPVGQAAAVYLASHGVGRLRVAGGEGALEESDLQAAPLAARPSIGVRSESQAEGRSPGRNWPSAFDALAQAVRRADPEVRVEAVSGALDLGAADALLVAGLREAEAGPLLEAARREGRTAVLALAARYAAAVAVLPAGGACHRCLGLRMEAGWPGEGGWPFGVAAGLAGALAAVEVTKAVLGMGGTAGAAAGRAARGRLLLFEVDGLTLEERDLEPRGDCPACGGGGPTPGASPCG